MREAQFVLPTIASTLGVRERAGQPLRETLARVLAPKQLLLLLDNCEQVLEAAPEIAALLAACPQSRCWRRAEQPYAYAASVRGRCYRCRCQRVITVHRLRT